MLKWLLTSADSILTLQHGGYSERGPRVQNQDYLHRDPAAGLFIVADGMGGHRAGEVASRLAADTLVEFINQTSTIGELTWPFPFDTALSQSANRLVAGIRLANRKVFEAGRTDAQLSGMGTTLVAALVGRSHIVIGHVGDSRAYRLRSGRLDQMTHDHTWVAVVLGNDAVHEDHPMRHVLTSGIGMREDVNVDLVEQPIEDGDRWLLCSDGVHGYVDESVLATALEAPSPELAAERVVRAAIDSGGSDNATAIVLRFV